MEDHAAEAAFVGDPNFEDFKKRINKFTVKDIFRIDKNNLQLFFDERNLKVPANEGETRRSLDLLAQCGYNEGFC